MQADALITIDPAMAAKAEHVVPLAPLEALGSRRQRHHGDLLSRSRQALKDIVRIVRKGARWLRECEGVSDGARLRRRARLRPWSAAAPSGLCPLPSMNALARRRRLRPARRASRCDPKWV